MMKAIKVFIVDDHPMVLAGLKALLSIVSAVEVIGTAANAYEAIEHLKISTPDVVIVDINLPEVSGIELTKKIKTEFDAIHVLAMSTFKERSYVSKMIQAGALGYLVKSASREEIEAAIISVSQGILYENDELRMLDDSNEDDKAVPIVSRREQQVLQLIVDGLTNPQIAEKLFISLHTVDSHRKNLLAKFDVSNTASLIRMSIKHKLVEM
ncbi:MAG: response regulator transcription factor [Chryseolinea sp.]